MDEMDTRVPDPFAVGDDEEEVEAYNDNLLTPTVPAQEAPGVQSPSPVQKDAPPIPPPKIITKSQGDIRPLLSVNMFLPVPDSDPLTLLVAKYIPDPQARPRRDLSGDYTHTDLRTLIMTNSWRATARLARDQLTSGRVQDVSEVLEWWCLRLHSLARLRLYNQTAAECTTLFNVISSLQPPEFCNHVKDLLPLDLDLCRCRLRYWANDSIGYVDALMLTLNSCKRSLAKAMKRNVQNATVDGSVERWTERCARVSLVLASQLVEMKQYTTATRILETMILHPSAPPDLQGALAMVYLQVGDLGAASFHLNELAVNSRVDQVTKTTNEILKACFMGEWATAVDMLQGRAEELVQTENYVQRAIDANNLAVALLNLGKLSEGIAVLEDIFVQSPSMAVVAEPLIFNLATMYELRSNTAMDRKTAMLSKVALWSGDGLRHAVLKLG
ncbi:SubName: Full=Uncharacterized protein {ECO:0000313/EMBL:CCA67893.1} [Serendipita indica DSM 11827]|nr:SubName: Full=Uncharacterized protein {ECO:0000313/EMBL:CCA67893.1} [Serendipita indica DSM 11827]